AMRILVLSAGLPFPPVGGGKLRTFHLLRSLARKHELTLVGFTWGEPIESPPFPVRVFDVPWEWPAVYRAMNEGDPESAARAAQRLTHETEEPWFASVLESALMEETLARCAQDGFDLVWIDRCDIGRFISVLPRRLPKVLDFVDVCTRMAMRAT